jgi:hypothetical protein
MSTTETIPVEPELPPPSVTLTPGQSEAPPRMLFDEGKPPYTRLFLISFFLLFFELVCIRWFGSTVVFLTFFTNIVLIASFLGMSVGLMTGSRKRNFINWTLPIMAVACALSAALLYVFQHYPDLLKITVGNQKSPAQIYFGTEYREMKLTKVVVPMPVIAGVFFTLISLAFVGLGQEMGRAFDAIPNRLAAYSVDILGSLFGIALFSALSYAWTNPLIWFTIAAVLMIYFVGTWTRWQSLALVIVLAVTGFTSFAADLGASVLWSPYYKIVYNPAENHSINTNNIAHQNMFKLSDDTHLYPLVHALNRDAGNQPFDDIMIIGAGSGNDVQAARMAGAKHIDAVEIDPGIQFIGATDHPDKPYSDKDVVTFRNTDGRQWLKRHATSPEKYDLEIYALVDSLVLHSGYSSLRLESFLFTQNAFEDVKANLRPGGVFAMYNYYRQGWVVGRLVKMAHDVFGTEPLVFSFSATDIDKKTTAIGPDDGDANAITFVLVGLPDTGSKFNARLEEIRAKLKDAGDSYWLATNESFARRTNGYAATQPATPAATQPSEMLSSGRRDLWRQAVPATVTVDEKIPVPTDDWPQLYLREKKLPPEVQMSMYVIGGLSLLILAAFSSKASIRPSGRMFFLGAGFMLLETKGVVHMSLLFGSTWITNSVVFFAILVMVLLANVFVALVKPRKLWPYYILLVLALGANVAVQMATFLAMDNPMRMIASCAVVFVPVFFAGVIFGATFRDSTRPDADLGWNIAGIIVGALAENLSVVLGFNQLLLIAIGFYLLSMPWVKRTPLPTPAIA